MIWLSANMLLYRVTSLTQPCTIVFRILLINNEISWLFEKVLPKISIQNFIFMLVFGKKDRYSLRNQERDNKTSLWKSTKSCYIVIQVESFNCMVQVHVWTLRKCFSVLTWNLLSREQFRHSLPDRWQHLGPEPFPPMKTEGACQNSQHWPLLGHWHGPTEGKLKRLQLKLIICDNLNIFLNFVKDVFTRQSVQGALILVIQHIIKSLKIVC